MRHRGPVKIRPDADVIFARSGEHMGDVALDRVQRHLGAFAAIGAQKAGGKVQADHPAAVTDGAKLAVGQVAAGGADGMGVGMGGDEGRVGKLCHVPKAGFVQMAKVKHHAQGVAFPHEVTAKGCQPRPGIAGGRKAERNPVAKDGRAAPHRADGPQAHRVKEVQRVKVRADGFGPFKVDHPRHHA